MDDELSVQGLLEKFLQNCGYRVSVASDGMQALNVYKEALETDDPIDAVVMDLIVNGGLGGMESFKLIRNIHPEAVGIVSSAYCEDNSMAEYEKLGFRAVLTKPYQLLDLKRILEDLLDK